MRKITEYFRSALIASTKMHIDFKNNKFETLSYEEIENGRIRPEQVKFLWEKGVPEEKDIYENRRTKDVILAVKTIATEFLNHANVSDRLEEMTCVFFVPARVDLAGWLSCPQEGKWPWIPREFLDAMEDAQLVVGSADKVDVYLEKTTDKRNIIKVWQDYLSYTKKMYEEVTGAKYDEDLLFCGSERVKTDGNCYIFPDETVNAVQNILRLYNYILESDENALYSKMTNGVVEASKPLVLNTDTEKMKLHVGQMSGEYPLSPSQREVIHHMSELNEGDVLAVSGPPGTGKTTLIQAVVASEYVAHALEEKAAPVIVAASTNNQAVTNIIDSFGKVNQLGIANLEKHWIGKVHSFATYFPAPGKVEEAQKKGYQYTDVLGNGIIEELENKHNREKFKEIFLSEFHDYYKKDIKDLKGCKEIILDSLRQIDKDRRQCLAAITEIKGIIGNQTYKGYITCLDIQVDKAKARIRSNKEYIEKVNRGNSFFLDRKRAWQESYDKLPWYVRLFKCLPCIKKRIENWSYDFMESEELKYLQRGMSNDDVQEIYKELIDENDNVIRSLEVENRSVEEELRLVESKKQKIDGKIELLRASLKPFQQFSIFSSEENEKFVIDEFDISKFNNVFDKVRYVQFWMAVHYYECRWLIEPGLTDKQKGKTYENVLNTLYKRLAMLSPCMVMTFHSLPKQFCAFVSNEKKHIYMSNYIDLLIVDEAGQTSPEIALPSFYLAKKAMVVGDERQISPVWGIQRALDIALAKKNEVIHWSDEYKILEDNGLNCSESSVMKVAALSCAYNKYGRGLFLSEHRRCYNEIIEYCNKLVYGSKLEPLRGSGEKNPNNPLHEILPTLGYKNINSPISRKVGGSRCNVEEAKQIAIWIKNNFSNLCQKYSESAPDSVLGIITPFKTQSSVIKAQIQKIAPEYRNMITVGTVHTFQGAERQIIIFSSVYGKQEGCFFINRSASLMNVAVSRAKDSFLVFGDRECLVGGETSAAGLLKEMVKEEIE